MTLHSHVFVSSSKMPLIRSGNSSSLFTSCDLLANHMVLSFHRYPFYSKYTHAYGIPVVASSAVSDKAVKKACYIVRFLFADRHDIRENMYKYFGRVAVVGRHESMFT